MTHLSDGESDDVILVHSSKGSIVETARVNARIALQHLEHAYVAITTILQDRSKEKEDAYWLDARQDRLDMVLFIYDIVKVNLQFILDRGCNWRCIVGRSERR